MNGTIPQILKSAIIIPIYKSGSYGEPSNYRPVALTSHLTKVFEKVIRTAIIKHLEVNNLFNPGQHGFRSGRSCLTQLVDHYEFILSEVEQGNNVDVIYLDFAKAFDKVDFIVVLKKMSSLGITGNILRWISCFLKDRHQSVIVESHMSNKSKVLSGVPQGSVLGPIIFLLLIGDIDEDVKHSRVRSFADDTRVAKGISEATDVLRLQQDLNCIFKWAPNNNMAFNNTKFDLIRYGNDENLKSSSSYLNGDLKEIEEKTSLRDLGVMMDNDLGFKTHIQNAIAKGRNISSWILRTFRNRNRLCMLTLWKSLALPKIEYCSQLWHPYRKGDLQNIEMLQWSFIRKIKDCYVNDYWQALGALKLYSIQRRFERYRIIFVWKILEGLIPNLTEHPFEVVNSIRTGRKCKILTSLTRSKLGQIRTISIPVHGAQLFNKLPRSIRNARNCTVLEFKTKLDKYLSRIPDEPQLPGYTACRSADTNSLLDMIDVYRRRLVDSTRHLDA